MSQYSLRTHDKFGTYTKNANRLSSQFQNHKQGRSFVDLAAGKSMSQLRTDLDIPHRSNQFVIHLHELKQQQCDNSCDNQKQNLNESDPQFVDKFRPTFIEKFDSLSENAQGFHQNSPSKGTANSSNSSLSNRVSLKLRQLEEKFLRGQNNCVVNNNSLDAIDGQFNSQLGRNSPIHESKNGRPKNNLKLSSLLVSQQAKREDCELADTWCTTPEKINRLTFQNSSEQDKLMDDCDSPALIKPSFNNFVHIVNQSSNRNDESENNFTPIFTQERHVSQSSKQKGNETTAPHTKSSDKNFESASQLRIEEHVSEHAIDGKKLKIKDKFSIFNFQYDCIVEFKDLQIESSDEDDQNYESVTGKSELDESSKVQETNECTEIQLEDSKAYQELKANSTGRAKVTKNLPQRTNAQSMQMKDLVLNQKQLSTTASPHLDDNSDPCHSNKTIVEMKSLDTQMNEDKLIKGVQHLKKRQKCYLEDIVGHQNNRQKYRQSMRQINTGDIFSNNVSSNNNPYKLQDVKKYQKLLQYVNEQVDNKSHTTARRSEKFQASPSVSTVTPRKNQKLMLSKIKQFYSDFDMIN